jgi:hypothetical protein
VSGFWFLDIWVLLAGNEFFALKKVLIQTEEQVELVKQEIHASSLFNHPNLLPLLDYAIITVKVPRELHTLGFMILPQFCGLLFLKVLEFFLTSTKTNRRRRSPDSVFMCFYRRLKRSLGVKVPGYMRLLDTLIF